MQSYSEEKLIEAGIDIMKLSEKNEKSLKNKIGEMKRRGLSYQAIADSLNVWKVPTRTGNGKWHAKTTREVLGGTYTEYHCKVKI